MVLKQHQIVAVKCNIVSQVLSKLYELQYSTSCSNKDNYILENYIESLNCLGLDFIPCGPKDTNCSKNSVIFKCNFKVTKIVILSKEVNTIVYGLESTGGKAPYTYNWFIDTSDFNIAGPVNQDAATFTVKADKDLALLVSPVSVTVVDADGCTSNKICTLTPQGLKCSMTYAPCPNSSGLVVVSKATYCAVANNLIVTNI